MAMNPIDVSNVLEDDRQLRALTGLARPEFEKLLEEFIRCLKKGRPKNCRKPQKKRKRKLGGGRKSALGSAANQLLFILFYMKSYPTFDVLAFTFGISLGCASESVQRLLPLLKQAQDNLHTLPKRTSDNPKEIKQLIENNDKIIIDATERPCCRPQKPSKQKKYYSGKKGRHTVKNTVVSDSEKRILVLGETVPGSQHDYAVFKEEFDKEIDGFESTEASVDLGYLGIQKDYLSPQNIHIPHKKPRKSKKNPNPELTPKQRRQNRKMGRVRVVVEHAIGGMKVFQVLAIRLRNRLKNFADDFIFVAAGLWNLKNSFVVQ
jgi:hypothetical protein